jgi:starch synthase
LIDTSKLSKLTKVHEFEYLGHKVTLLSAYYEEIPLLLLDPHHPANFFRRDKIYAYPDDIARFTYFSKAAMEYLKNEPFDVLHLHDWHTSLCAALAKKTLKKVLSIHNVEYQGKGALLDLNDPAFEDRGSLNLLKGGIIHSDAIVPVSPTYAKEILTPEYGFGLDGILREQRAKVHGILNGIDQKMWDPAKDRALLSNYTLASHKKGKLSAKKEFAIDPKTPWVGAITRLVPQKGPKLIEAALQKTLELGGSFLLLGSSPIPELQKHFDALKEKYQGNPRVFLHYEYDETLSHKLYAALDFLIVPSLFEPCGLTQMIAMRYGTVPIVRATGGLKDSVFEEKNGFLFSDPTPEALGKALEKAIKTFQTAAFDKLIENGMKWDFSWQKPAKEYLQVYEPIQVK